MTVVVTLAGLWLIYTGHVWLALALVAAAAVAWLAWEVHNAPVIPEFDEERQR